MHKKAPNKVKQDKPVHSYGLWVPKKTVSQIYTCSCGNKYLKTRPRQNTCVECMRK